MQRLASLAAGQGHGRLASLAAGQRAGGSLRSLTGRVRA